MGAGPPGGWESRSILVGDLILPKKFYGSPKMAIRFAVTKPVTKPRNETIRVTKPTEDFVWSSRPGHDVQLATVLFSEALAVELRKRGGRPPAGAVAMSGAERARKYRERRRAAVAAS